MKHLRLLALSVAGLAVTGLCAVSCSVAPDTEEKRSNLHEEVVAAISEFRRADPGLERFFTGSVGYAVFPTVGKAGFIGGGAYGKGELFEAGRQVTGYCDLTQGSLGLQLGGQAFREIIFFENQAALDLFKSGRFTMAAQASAVAVTAGASTETDYDSGVAVFTLTTGGLMAEAAIAGQEFRFRPLP